MRAARLGPLIAALLSSAACYSMKPVALEELVAIRPTKARVTRSDQSVTVVWGPRVIENRLVGWVDGEYQVMPATDVQQVLVKRPARGRTAAAIAAGTVGAAALVYMLTGSGNYKDPCSTASSDCQ